MRPPSPAAQHAVRCVAQQVVDANLPGDFVSRGAGLLVRENDSPRTPCPVESSAVWQQRGPPPQPETGPGCCATSDKQTNRMKQSRMDCFPTIRIHRLCHFSPMRPSRQEAFTSRDTGAAGTGVASRVCIEADQGQKVEVAEGQFSVSTLQRGCSRHNTLRRMRPKKASVQCRVSFQSRAHQPCVEGSWVFDKTIFSVLPGQ